MYKVNKRFSISKGFDVNSDDVYQAITTTNLAIRSLPQTVFRNIDFKTTSAIIGGFFCAELSSICDGAMVNPIEKGHPDIIPIDGANASEAELRNYPNGLEIKCTIGNVKSGANLKSAQTRVQDLVSIVWQAHHRQVSELMGLVWDFYDAESEFQYPTITAVFYTDLLVEDDWGSISGTTGRNTKVSAMKSSGKTKMGKGWVALIDNPEFLDKYKKILNFNPID